ncbi:MAG: AAA family ATPase [Alphaproteobacteria bacterium]|nr:AAA family ATPase [Alphaproteobacteria bacterium]MBV9371252.1 AAA family ATPase [Alphaproteobacteria bacterium]MBV9902809.1 AAA family ATPase [Alphaproteobacteria bacterium]
MNQHSPLRTASLIERAAELYGFAPAAAPPAKPEPKVQPQPEVVRAPQPQPRPQAEAARKPDAEPARAPRPLAVRAAAPAARTVRIERARLRAAALIEPEAPVGALAEEFRIVKRQLLLNLRAATELPEAKRRSILVCSAQPDDGKTFCALNLALSLAGEKDLEVLLVDADFPKPEILSTLGVESAGGLVDALADPSRDPEDLVLATDVKGLSLLPAGRPVDNVTELLASERTQRVLARLAEANPRRIILFDSPPALMASPATALAGHAGQLLMVVRADKTTEGELREALDLLSGCERVSLVLNGTGLAAGGRRFGAYYGYGT